jgi:hypothetical protein
MAKRIIADRHHSVGMSWNPYLKPATYRTGCTSREMVGLANVAAFKRTWARRIEANSQIDCTRGTTPSNQVAYDG